jgi:membrane protease YdiL (CAAX protease family)
MTATEQPRQQPETRYPYWGYVDLLMFIGMVLPCLTIGGILARLLGSASPALEGARVWVAMLVFYIAWFGSLYLILKSRHQGQPFGSALGWVYPRRGMIACIASGPVLAIAVGLLGAVLKTPMVDLPMKELLKGSLSLALFGVFSIVIGPVMEELAFRGFLMPLLMRTFGREVGILFTAVPFGLLHGTQYGWHWQYVVLVGTAGLVFGIAREATGSTLASAALHSTYNMTFYVAYVAGTATL